MNCLKSKNLTVDNRMVMTDEDWLIPYKEEKVSQVATKAIIKFLKMFL